MKTNYRDPNLSNGAGHDGKGINFENDIQATWFTQCL